MNTIANTFFTGWHLMRWVRLIVGILFLVKAVRTGDWLIGILAGFVLITSIANVGCCGAKTCAVPGHKEIKSQHDEIRHEDVGK